MPGPPPWTADGQDMGNTLIVVGLGNPGGKYKRTPHNAGFMVIDELAGRCGCIPRRKLSLRASVGVCTVGGRETWLVKPATFVNNSGSAVSAVLRKTGAPASNLIVVLDDADLKRGQLRIRASGGDGGHNGMRSIIRSIATDNFIRVRLGIGRGESDSDLSDHVLKPLSAGDEIEMRRAADRAADAILAIIEEGVESAMNKFNA